LYISRRTIATGDERVVFIDRMKISGDGKLIVLGQPLRHNRFLRSGRDITSGFCICTILNKIGGHCNAPHFGYMFDMDDVRNKVMSFLKKQLK
jgi:hypothetical protein